MATARQQNGDGDSRNTGVNLPPIRTQGQTTAANPAAAATASGDDSRTRRMAAGRSADQRTSLPRLHSARVQQIYEGIQMVPEGLDYKPVQHEPHRNGHTTGAGATGAGGGMSSADGRTRVGVAGTGLGQAALYRAGVESANHSRRGSGHSTRGTGISATQAITQFPTKLSKLEMTEIFDFDPVYYVGQAMAGGKKNERSGPHSKGYDTEDGSYVAITHDHIAFRFEILKVLGKGSFGQVLKVSSYLYTIHCTHDCTLHIVRVYM